MIYLFIHIYQKKLFSGTFTLNRVCRGQDKHPSKMLKSVDNICVFKNCFVYCWIFNHYYSYYVFTIRTIGFQYTTSQTKKLVGWIHLNYTLLLPPFGNSSHYPVLQCRYPSSPRWFWRRWISCSRSKKMGDLWIYHGLGTQWIGDVVLHRSFLLWRYSGFRFQVLIEFQFSPAWPYRRKDLSSLDWHYCLQGFFFIFSTGLIRAILYMPRNVLFITWQDCIARAAVPKELYMLYCMVI